MNARPPDGRLALSPLVVGDPETLADTPSTQTGLLSALGISGPAAGILPLAPGIGLAHALHGRDGALGLRWVRVATELPTAAGPVRLIAVLTGPLYESGRLLRAVERLVACLRQPDVARHLGDATTREQVVGLLARAEQQAGECPLEVAPTFAVLGSRREGLNDDEAARRRATCGPNRIERVRRRSLAGRFLEQFTSFFAVLLWVGGGLAFLAGMPELGWAIFAVIAVNGIFSFLQEYRAERAVEALQELLPQEVTVLRGARETRLAASDLVPGDVIVLDEGDHVPADGQLVDAAGLRVDESPLTGESHPVFKLPVAANQRENVPFMERHELIFAGTAVVAGTGTVVVRATAMATEIGRIAHLTQTVVPEPSPLQREMARITRLVTFLAVGFGVGFFALGAATRMLGMVDGLTFALGVIVANVPEGLLPTLTLALALGVQRMARAGSVVKRLSAVETLGATTVICTDKTGTLTANHMTLRWLWTSGRALAGGLDRDTEARAVLEAGVLASHATAERGDPTEMAIVAAARDVGIDAAALRLARPLLAPHPFDSFRKRMTLVRTTGDGAMAYVKGAPRETLALCTRVRWDGGTVELDDERRRAILADHDRLAAEGLRILAVCVRPLPAALTGAATGSVEGELTFLGLVALWDPPRPAVRTALTQCQHAGIRVIMVTGDYGLTAQAIARDLGLLVHKVVTGEEVERLGVSALAALVAEPGVLFARTSPSHKLAIVEALRARGEVVAVTGDGVNDAPALRAAAIGVAMGRRGSDVAKEAAEMVITDDNFASIVTAIREGRTTYANMGKFVTYIFASNVPELVPFLAFVFLGIPLPLTVMQILAVDLGTDLLPALALGVEPPEPGIMDRPPRRPDERLLNGRRLARAYGFLGTVEATLSLLAFFWVYWRAGWRPGLPMARSGSLYRRATTMTLGGIVAAQVGNVFCCRTDRESVFRVGLLTNRLVLWGIAAEIAIFAGLVLVAPLQRVFGLAPLAFAEWGLLLFFPPVMLVAEEARKTVVRAWTRSPVDQAGSEHLGGVPRRSP